MLKKMASRDFSARRTMPSIVEAFMKNPKFLAKIICIILYLTLVALCIAFFFIPSVSMLACFWSIPLFASLIFFYLGWVCAVELAWLFIRIMFTVQEGTPFVQQNVRSLRRIALYCGICALDFLFALFFHPSITFGFCAAILFFGCLCALVLAGVFAQSVQYKEENDLTI